MRKKSNACKSLALLLVSVFVLTGCSGSEESGTGTLRVGVRSDIANFSFYNETAGKYYGLEVDLANELADRLGYADVEFSTVTPEDRKETLLNGEVDCLIAAYSIAETRLENFDFSEPYYEDETSVMVEKSSLINSIEEMKGMTFGVLSGSNAGPLLAIKLNEMGMISDKIVSDTEEKSVYEGATVLKFPTYEDLYWALQEGTVDAACMDGCIAKSYQDEDMKLLDITIEEQNYGVATQKGSDLSKDVAEAVSEMKKDGSLETIINNWL